MLPEVQRLKQEMLQRWKCLMRIFFVKAVICIGGAQGKGAVFLGGKKVGKTKMSQITHGMQLGGQEDSQMIFPRRSSI